MARSVLTWILLGASTLAVADSSCSTFLCRSQKGYVLRPGVKPDDMFKLCRVRGPPPLERIAAACNSNEDCLAWTPDGTLYQAFEARLGAPPPPEKPQSLTKPFDWRWKPLCGDDKAGSGSQLNSGLTAGDLASLAAQVVSSKWGKGPEKPAGGSLAPADNTPWCSGKQQGSYPQVLAELNRFCSGTYVAANGPGSSWAVQTGSAEPFIHVGNGNIPPPIVAAGNVYKQYYRKQPTRTGGSGGRTKQGCGVLC